MKPIVFAFILMLLLFQSCVGTRYKNGTEYRSICTLYHVYPALILRLNTDGSFLYKMALYDKKITGKWRIHKSCLILESVYFTNAYADRWADSIRYEFLKKADGDTLLIEMYTRDYIRRLMPAHKYTQNDQSDSFLIRGRRLFAIDSNGIRKHCSLVKVK